MEESGATGPHFDRGWEKWIAENLMKGVSAAKLIDRMAEHGFARGFAEGKSRD